MQKECDGSSFVTPTAALESACRFLKEYAPDLIPPSVELPSFSVPSGLNISKGEGVGFSTIQDDGKEHAGISVGNVSVLWISSHPELFEDGSETNGLKVKMRFNDNSERYAWVIIDKYGKPQVFERNIYWDFKNFKRETQMWLHDGWIKAHSLI